MIDRSNPLTPLTLPWIRAWFLVSLMLFLALLAVFAVLYAIGGVCYGACAVWVGLAYALFYLVASLPLILGIGLVIGAAKSKEGDAKGAGCLGLIVLWVLGQVMAATYGWADGYSAWVRVGTMAHADSAWNGCVGWAQDVYQFFLDWQIYLWSWGALAGALGVSAILLGLIGLARLDAPARRLFLGVRWQCPRCPATRPLFLCPGCGFEHEPLATRHGIWRAKCGHCGTKFGTTSLSGLLQLSRICSGCRRSLDHPDLGRLPEYHIAIVGAKNSGKTNLIIAALHELETRFAPERGLELAFASTLEERDYREQVGRLLAGRGQDQTARSERPFAFAIALKPKVGVGGVLVYLYDASGEDIQDGDQGIGGHDFHQIVDGVVLVIDPFAEGPLRQRVEAERPGGLPAGLNPAPYDGQYILGRMLPFWMRTQKSAAQGRLNFPVAVVLTKLDAGGLAQRVGGYPEFTRSHATYAAVATEATRYSEGVRKLLAASGVDDLPRLVSSHFRAACFFGTSAFGRSADPADSTPFRPRGVVAPLAWLLTEAGALSDARRPVQAARRASGSLGRVLTGGAGATRALLTWAALAVTAALLLVLATRLIG